MAIAEYLEGTGTRTGAGSISITDTSGTWTASGAVAFASTGGFNWSATFYDGADEPGGPGEDTPTGPGGGGGGTTVRRCTLVLSGGTGAGTFDFATSGVSLSGTFSLSAPVKSIVRVGTGSGADIAEGYDYQNGALSHSLTLMGYTITLTTSSTTNRVLPTWTLRSRSSATSPGAGDQTVAWTTEPGACTAPSTSISKSGTAVVISGSDTYTYSVSATTGSGSCYSSVSKSISGAQNGPTVYAEGYALSYHDRDALFYGRLNRLMATWPDAILWRLYDSATFASDADGSVSATIEQRRYDHYSTCYDHTVPSFTSATDRETLNTHELIKPQVRYVSGGVTYTQPLFIHGPRWDAISISRTETHTVDDGSTLTPTGDWAGSWTASGGSVAVVSGAIEVTGGSGKVARRNFTNGLKQTGWQGYSRLRIRLKSSAADHSITVRLGVDTTISGVTYKAPTWTIQTGTADTYTEHWIDLGADENGPDLAIEGNGVTFGVGSFRGAYNPRAVADLYLTDLGAGTYSIDSVTLSSESDGAGGYHDPLYHIAPSQGSTQPAIFGIVDGSEVYRLSFPPTQKISDTISYGNSATVDYRFGYTLSDLDTFSSPSSEPWPASDLTSSFHDSRFLGGGGLLWDGSSQSWSIPFDTGAVSSTIPAQWLVGSVQWDWPSSLLGFAVEDAGSRHIGGGVWIGYSVWGRVLSTSDSASPAGRDGLSGEAVTMSTVSGATLATTTTDADGWFLLPAVASDINLVRLTAAGRTMSLPLSWFRTRVVLTPYTPPDGSLLAMATSATNRVVRGYKDTGNVLLLEFRRLPASWEAVITSLTLTGSGALCYDTHGAEQRLWLAYEDSGGIKTRYTEDEGSTWSVATTIFSAGSNPAIATSPTSVRHYYCIDGTAIKTKILDSQGSTLTATTTVVASGVASSAIDAVYAGEEILLTYKSSSGAVISVVSADGGLTFS